MQQDTYEPIKAEDQQTLMRLAYEVVEHGLQYGDVLSVSAKSYSDRLQFPQASFVTIRYQENLVGCIGSLQAVRPLVMDVTHNAYAAAFQDPRTEGVNRAILSGINFHLSLLSPSTPMTFTNEADLLSQLKPDIDGLVLEEGMARSTFLPAVWEQLPNPETFLSQLKLKAGLSENHWSNTIKFKRYTVQSIP